MEEESTNEPQSVDCSEEEEDMKLDEEYNGEYSNNEEETKNETETTDQANQVNNDIVAILEKRNRKSKRFLTGLLIFSAAIMIMTAIVQNFPESGRNPIDSSGSMNRINYIIENTIVMMQKPLDSYGSLFNNLDYMKQALKNPAISNYTFENIESYGFIGLLTNMVKRSTMTCENPVSQSLIAQSLSFMYEYISLGKDFYADPTMFKQLIQRCDDVQTITELTFIILSAGVNGTKFQKSIKGIAKTIYTYSSSIGFGPWSAEHAFFFNKWIETGTVSSEDKNSICDFMSFALENRGMWGKAFINEYGLISVSLDCLGKNDMIKSKEL